MNPTLLFGRALLGALSSLPCAAQAWRTVDDAPPNDHATAFDPVRGVVVSLDEFGNLREWNGSRWLARATSGPRPSGGALLTYDSSRQQLFAFDGGDATTWSLSGSNWTQLATAGPAPREDAAMCYDPGRDVVVLHGGLTRRTGAWVHRRDTWEWDGIRWNARSTSGPNASLHHMVFDPTTRTTLLYGGTIGNFQTVELTDTWSWDGASWTLLASGGPPDGRGELAWDSARNVALYVTGERSAPPQAWEWDGVRWSPGVGPAAPYLQGMAYDAVRANFVATHRGETWVLAGTTWNSMGSTAPYPDVSFGAAVDRARNRLVVAIRHDTFEWDGSRWHEMPQGNRGYVSGSRMAFDAVRNVTVLVTFNRTWEWNGSDWAGGQGMFSSSASTLAFDPVRGQVIGFGGWGNETRAWDGQQWQTVSNTGPPPRDYPAMATDLDRSRVVMFGGQTSDPTTWEWDGSTWRAAAVTGPSPRVAHAMAWDELRGRVVLHGGTLSAGGAAWEWDGAVWIRSALAADVPLWNHVMFSWNGRLLALWGNGTDASGRARTTALMRRLEVDTIGDGCGTGAVVPRLTASTTRPAIGSSVDVVLAPVDPANTAWLVAGTAPLTPAVSLAPTGLPSCHLIAEPLTLAPMATANGSGTLTLIVPPVSSLRGLRVIAQGVTIGSGGASLSAGLAVRIE